MKYWETLRSDDGAHFDREVKLDAASLPPIVTWGTSPGGRGVHRGRGARPDKVADEGKRANRWSARSPTWGSRPAPR